MTNTEIKEVHRKLSLPVRRDESGKVMPIEFSEKETNFILFEMMHKMREENRKKNGGKAFKRHWNKASKKERGEINKWEK